MEMTIMQTYMEKPNRAAPSLTDFDQDRQRFDIMQLIEELCDWYRQVLSARNLLLKTKINTGIPQYFFGNQLLTKHIFFEPGKNSLLYLKPEEEVCLEISSEQLAGRRHAIYLNIDCSGTVIPWDKEKELFHPSRFSNGEGFKLRSANLYYARMIARILGGDLRVNNRSGFGIRYHVEVRLLRATA